MNLYANKNSFSILALAASQGCKPKGGFMKRYETIFISLPDLSDEDRQNVFGKIKDLIPKQGGTMIKFDEWGLKNLAYEIKKQMRGYYAYMDYGGSGGLVKELERVMRLDDRVMKYMTVSLEEEFDPARAESSSGEDSSDDALKAPEKEQKATDTISEEGA